MATMVTTSADAMTPQAPGPAGPGSGEYFRPVFPARSLRHATAKFHDIATADAAG